MPDVKFITVEAFKAQVGTSRVSILLNAKTDKLFMSTDNGDTYRVQGDIDRSKEMRVLIPETGIADACLVNVSGGASEQFAL